MTLITDTVQSLFTVANLGSRIFRFGVTGRATFGMVTRGAINAVFLSVIAVEQSYNSTAAVGRSPDFLLRFN